MSEYCMEEHPEHLMVFCRESKGHPGPVHRSRSGIEWPMRWPGAGSGETPGVIDIPRRAAPMTQDDVSTMKRNPPGVPWFRGTIAVAAYPEGTVTVVEVKEWLCREPTEAERLNGRLTNHEWLKEEFAQTGTWEHGPYCNVPDAPGIYEGVVWTWAGEDGDSMTTFVWDEVKE